MQVLSGGVDATDISVLEISKYTRKHSYYTRV